MNPYRQKDAASNEVIDVSALVNASRKRRLWFACACAITLGLMVGFFAGKRVPQDSRCRSSVTAVGAWFTFSCEPNQKMSFNGSYLICTCR